MNSTSRTFHCTEDGSAKFWTVAIGADGKSFTATFGKIGSAGQSKEKRFANADECAKEVAKLVREKTGKGYVEQGVAPEPAVNAPSAVFVPASPSKKFTKADFKAAAKALQTLDRDSIDSVIKSGMPLDEAKFPVRGSYLGTAIEAVMAAGHAKDNLDTATRARKIDDAVVHLAGRGATIPADDARGIARQHLWKTLDRLIANALDLDGLDERGNTFLAELAHDPVAVEELLARGSDPRIARGLLHQVCIFGPHALLQRLVEEIKLPIDEYFEDQTVVECADDYFRSITTNNLPIAEAQAKNPRAATRINSMGHTPAQEVEFYRNQERNRNYLVALAEQSPPQKKVASGPNPDADGRLFEICKERELDKLRAIERALKEGASASARDADGKSLLHHIAAARYPHIIEQATAFLIREGADPRALDDEGRTPLFYFFTGYSGSTEAARFLVESGIDPTHKDKHARNALAHLFATAPEKESHDARYSARGLLEAGVPAIDCDSEKNTALHLFVSQQDIGGEAESLLKLAIAKGAGVDARNAAGRTPLHLAVMRPKDKRYIFHDYLIKELLKAKADINAQDPDGQTAIHLAADPDSDFFELISGNPDLTVANKASVTALQHIKNLGYYDAKEHKRLTKDIDALIKEPATARKLPALAWKSATIGLDAVAPTKLEIVSSWHVQDNDADDDLVHLGGNRLSISGNIPSSLTVFDTAAGKILWSVDGVEDGDNNIVSDDFAVYVARDRSGTRSLTAHHHDTGATLWECAMSTSYKQFGTRIVCTPNYVVHASRSASKFYPVHKKTGKKYVAPLLYKYPQQKSGNNHDWGIQRDQPRWCEDSLIPYKDTLIVLGVKQKQHRLTVDQYDLTAKGEHMRALAELPEDALPIGHHLYGDALYLFTNDGHLRKIDIAKGEIVLDHNHSPKVEHTFGRDTFQTTFDHTVSGDRLYYVLRSDCGNYRAHHTYDLSKDKLIDVHHLKEKLPLSIYRPSSDGKRIYCFGEHGGTGKNLVIYDLAKDKVTSELTFPNYGGYDWVEQRLVLGDAIYAVQKGGIENGDDSSVLHRVQ